MKLKQRVPGGVWYVHFTGADGERKRISTETKDEKQAQLKALQIMSEQLVDKMPEDDRRKHANLETLAGILRDAWHRKWKEQPSSAGQYALVNKISRLIGHWPWSAITYERLEDFLNGVESNKGTALKAATKNRYVACIRSAMHMRARRDSTLVMPNFPFWEENNVRERYMTRAEEADALQRIADRVCNVEPKWAYLSDLVVVLLDTGMRCSEALEEMTAASIRRRPSGEVYGVWLRHGTTKSGKGRVIPLTERAQAAVERMFASALHGTWTSEEAGRAWRAVIKGTTYADVNLHILRHTTASRLAEAGVDIYQIAAFLGHSSLEMTKRYAHLSPKALEGALAVLENGIRAAANDCAVPVRHAQPDAYSSPEAHPMQLGTLSTANSNADNDFWCPEPESNRHGLAAGGF